MSTDRVMRIVRFFVSGALSTATTLGVLYLLVESVRFNQVLASVVGFLCGVVVSFTLQKWWTFKDHATDRIRMQASLYLFIVLANTMLNTVCMYIGVELLGVQYLVAQIITALLISVESFFLYRLVFRTPAAV